MHIIFASLCPFIGALGYRSRGGFLPLGSTQLARIVYWGLPVGAAMAYICTMYGVPAWYGIACGILAWAGCCIPHAKWMASDKLSDVGMMALIGVAHMLLMILPLVLFHPRVAVFIPLGELEGIAYYLGWRFLAGHSLSLFGRAFAFDGAEWGEALTGFFFGCVFSALCV
jgi:hypothetical protein